MRLLAFAILVACVQSVCAQSILKDPKELSVLLNEVVVTGTGTEHYLKDAPVQTEVITGKALDSYQGRSMQDILEGLNASITFNPIEVANNMKKQGGFIPGVRPGRATAAYIKNALNKITLPSAVFLALIAIVPSIIFSFTGNQLIQAFGGTSILIMVGVVLDTVDKLEGQIKMYDYDGFFK